MTTGLQIDFTPLVPMEWLALVTGAALVLCVISSLREGARALPRILAAAAFIAALSGPSVIEEERAPVKSVFAVVVDDSASQDFGARRDLSAKALAYVRNKFKNRGDIDLRVIRAPANKNDDETKLFESLDRALADVPPDRRAGAVLITDGQIHDAPSDNKSFKNYGPLQALLTGAREEKDRRIHIIDAPAYGITGKNVILRFRVEDVGFTGSDTAHVTLNLFNGETREFEAAVNADQSIEIPIVNGGTNVFELKTDALPGELTAVNNRASAMVNGVRDRLRVLLVSGQPYAGGRVWRDLMTSDPAVDLVHFTILREPDMIDATPPHELALIPFPVDELFQNKLDGFDLVIFDRYKLSRVLPDAYFSNIVQYVRNGGALLVTAGPEFTGEDSVYHTPLMDILPAAPSGGMINAPFHPVVTPKEKTHPVMRDLSGQWGSWLRQAQLNVKSGDVLMTGSGNSPLLILAREGKGRVAQIASDQVWLWARGFEGGGPYSELMRRLAHWLMKDPELDERALTAVVAGDQIRLSALGDAPLAVSALRPDDAPEIVTLIPAGEGALVGALKAPLPGVYSFESADGRRAIAVKGAPNAPETAAVQTTDSILKPIADSSGGGIFWLADSPAPAIMMPRAGNNYIVTGVRAAPALPAWALAALVLALAAFAWWREGKSV